MSFIDNFISEDATEVKYPIDIDDKKYVHIDKGDGRKDEDQTSSINWTVCEKCVVYFLDNNINCLFSDNLFWYICFDDHPDCANKLLLAAKLDISKGISVCLENDSINTLKILVSLVGIKNLDIDIVLAHCVSYGSVKCMELFYSSLEADKRKEIVKDKRFVLTASKNNRKELVKWLLNENFVITNESREQKCIKDLISDMRKQIKLNL